MIAYDMHMMHMIAYDAYEGRMFSFKGKFTLVLIRK